MWRKILPLVGLLAFIPIRAQPQNPHEKLMNDLLASDLKPSVRGDTYVEDGAADLTVLWLPRRSPCREATPCEAPLPAIKAILALEQNAIPLLIEHLDDVRPSSATFRGKRVPIAYVVLDLLLHISAAAHDSRIFIPDCADDGLGACIEPGFYFRPDVSRSEMKGVRANWQRLETQRPIAFVYPVD